jgi:hypothetical protein
MTSTRYSVQYFDACREPPLRWEWSQSPIAEKIYRNLDEANDKAQKLAGRYAGTNHLLHLNSKYKELNEGREQWITASRDDISAISGTAVVFKVKAPTLTCPHSKVPKTLEQSIEDLGPKWRWSRLEFRTPIHGATNLLKRSDSESDTPDYLTLHEVDKNIRSLDAMLEAEAGMLDGLTLRTPVKRTGDLSRRSFSESDK